ncbi:histidine kinase [Fusarium globosum]|uniref:histidine kinase n=1 Tax=Fusarium globosum TaxID=78864 RepID=A0A8H5YJE1_9HYPO|nr:histidine kinase [Fusarium globosum]
MDKTVNGQRQPPSPATKILSSWAVDRDSRSLVFISIMSSRPWPPGEVIRERETFRYDPALIINAVPNSPSNLIPFSELCASSDAILTAFCQLAALRLNTTRALISLFDRSNQYVVAEATQDLRLLPNASLAQNDPGLWLCGTRFPRSFGVCERVLVAPSNEQPSRDPAVNSNPSIPADMRDDQLLATEPRLHTPGADSSAQSHHSTDSRPRVDRLKSTCASAADIMRDALEVDGLMLLDASYSRRSNLVSPSTSPRSSTRNKESTQAQANTQTLHRGNNTMCPVLSSSVAAEAKCDGNSYFGHETLSVAVLKKLLRYYPRGTIWNFEAGQDDSSEVHSDDSSVDATDESPVAPESGKTSPVSSVESPCSPGQLRRRQELRKEVLKMLPDAKSVAFFPVWDAQKRRWFAGGFAYSVKSSRVFSPRRELSYLRAFGTVLMAEVSSMRERETQRSKLGVLDSISHELRSPLHGIILGAGLLRGTRLDYSQQEALLSVEACSRTLLDAIDQILDWTKINRFSSSLTKDANYAYNDIDSRTVRSSRENSVEASMMNIASRVDLPNLVEEVIESIHAGHEFQKLSLGQKNDLCNGRVRVSVHFSPSPVWKFHVQAGAIRRIIMNILGNSLKFTTSGFIHIQVDQLDMPSTPAGSDVRLEDNMDAGTGLGLSVVRRIVQAMKGTVDVQSTSGVGTTVQVDLPLKCAEAPELVATDDVYKTWESELTDGHLKRLEGLKVSLVGFQDCLDNDPVLYNIPTEKEIISSTCQQWLGLDPIDSVDDQGISPDIVLCDDRSFDNAASTMRYNNSTPVIVFCQNAVMARKRTVANNLDRGLNAQNVFFTHQPIGPRRLGNLVLRSVTKHPKQQLRLRNRPGNERSVALGQNPPTPPAVNGENSNVFSEDLSLYSTTPNWYLPQQLPRSPLATPSEKPDPMCAKPRTSERLFLLVDDNPINLKMLVVFMKKLNLPYRTATDGQQAVDKYRENPKGFICVFMDISMPVMNGFEATRAIRKIENGAAAPRCAVFALTGLASQEAQQEAILSGIDLFLTKPIKLVEIRQNLETKHLIDV